MAIGVITVPQVRRGSPSVLANGTNFSWTELGVLNLQTWIAVVRTDDLPGLTSFANGLRNVSQIRDLPPLSRRR
jgi:hypothetical protein